MKATPKITLFTLVILWAFFACNRSAPPSEQTTPTLFDSVILQAERRYDSGRKMDAMDFVRSKHNTQKNLSLEDEMKYYSYVNTIIMKDIHDYDKSLELADSMILLLERSRNASTFNVRLIQAYNIKADALMAKGFYNDAYDNYFKARTLARATSDSCSLSAFSYSLGMVLYRQQNFANSAIHFRQAYDEAQSCKENFTYFYFRQEVLDNIGLCYGKMKQYDSAMAYYRKALKYIRENYNKYPNKKFAVYESAEAVVEGNLADIYIARGVYDTATSLLSESINVNLQKGYTNSDAELSQLKLARIYLKTGKTTDLQILLNNIRAELDSLPNKYVELEWNSIMSQFYLNKGDSARAGKFAMAHNAISDSIGSNNKALMRADVENIINGIEHQHKISLLETEKDRQQLVIIIFIVVALLAAIIVVIVMRNAARTGRNMEQMRKLNNEITEQKVKLESAIQEVEQRDVEKSRILRSVAHDVMSPISAVSALTDILISEGEEINGEHKAILQLIQEACSSSLSLSKDILEAAVNITPGEMQFELTDLVKLAHQCIDLLGVRAALKHQQLLFKTDEPVIVAYVNKDKIWRLFNNLISNAIKFSYERADIQIGIHRKDGRIRFSVKDKGIGIPEKNKSSIFDMFTESKMYGTSGEKPNGLGLSISLQIAKAHGGNIWFESEQGKGTTFYVDLPEKLPE